MTPLGFELVDFSVVYEKFKTETKSIFRLEMLQNYSVEYEKENWRNFKLGKSPELNESMAEWCEIVQSAKARNCAFERVRVIDLPISDYIKFECQWAYNYTIPAGENITVIENSEELKEFLQSTNLTILDFWLFSDNECYFMLYDLFGKFIGAAKNQKNIKEYVAIKDKCLEKSIELKSSHLASHVIL